ncbi:MAG TPA: acyl-CoA dehydrogenase family protein [Candidatus Sulfotelmatobacter sp.]|nr:acyl-CoA dehydrogenase family protein [Candidatus Sulfotelmatobacter sp.]
MSDTRNILTDAATRLLAQAVTRELLDQAEAGVWPEKLWAALENAGLTLAAVPEAAGGTGGAPGDELAVLRTAARFAAPVPLAETMLAGWLLASAGLRVPLGALSVAPVQRGDHLVLSKDGGGWSLSGTARRVPWAASVGHIAVLADGPSGALVALLPARGFASEAGRNLAGEPRHDLGFDKVKLAAEAVAPSKETAASLQAAGALARAAQMLGALENVLDLAVRYAGERSQFGRPIGKFQAVQQQLAVLAGQVAAAGRAVESAYEFRGRGADAGFAIAVAKARVGEAASIGAGIAHQVHGAIGFTHEHMLHHSTRRLWSWRSEFGGDAYWQEQIGRRIAKAGPDQLWPLMTGTSA